MSKNEFVDYVSDVLEEFGPIVIRSMFGGFGIYKEGAIFGLIAENELYFKADKETAIFFEKYGSTPFTYDNGKKLVQMSYWKVLPEIFDDLDMMKLWVNMAYDVAIKSKKHKKYG